MTRAGRGKPLDLQSVALTPVDAQADPYLQSFSRHAMPFNWAGYDIIADDFRQIYETFFPNDDSAAI